MDKYIKGMPTIKSEKIRTKFNKLHLKVAKYYNVEKNLNIHSDISFIAPSGIGFVATPNIRNLRDDYAAHLSCHFPWLLPFYLIRNSNNTKKENQALLRHINNIIIDINNTIYLDSNLKDSDEKS